jgi:predicted P-loop ATPase/GTPase
MSRILIVGAYVFDSGKTHFAIELGKVLQNTGQSVGYFKPISGHNYWFNYEHTKRCLELGKLISKDAFLAKKELELETELLLMNPVHTLFVPARINRPLQTIPSSLGLAGTSSIRIMQRFSVPTKKGIESTMLIAESLVEEESVIIELDEIGKLSHNSSIYSADDLRTFQEFEKEYYESYVSQAFAEIEKSAETIIIESFNDSAWPWETLPQVDHVLVVTPGHIFNYDPEKYHKATFLYRRNKLPIREVTFSRITDLLKPRGFVEIKAGRQLGVETLSALEIRTT